MKVKDLTNDYGVRLAVSREEDPEKDLKRGDKVLLERFKSARYGQVSRYALILGILQLLGGKQRNANSKIRNMRSSS